MNLRILWQRADIHTGRYFLSDKRAMVTVRISLSLHLQAIHILLILICLQMRGFLRKVMRRNLTGVTVRSMLITEDCLNPDI